MMTLPVKYITAFFLCALMCGAAAAQRVGVVFSGGGAKGMAHLGIIQALEENNIPIDFITGTSIGAIVGGMYACGYTAEDIAAYFESSDFQRWLSGDYKGETSEHYKQFIADAQMLSMGFYMSKGMMAALPTNMVPPYEMDFAFVSIFAGASAASGGDLNALMIPFRAVSTNIYYKKQYAPRYGDVAMLVRASMSFPGIFKPTLIDSAMLLDGGLSNNFPVNLMQEEFAPDLIIGSNCQHSGATYIAHEDDIVSQIYALATNVQSKCEMPSEQGWIINFDSLSVELMEFEKIRMLMKAGYDYAMRIMPQIKERVHRRTERGELEKRRAAFRAKIPPLLFKNVSVHNGTPKMNDYIKSRLTHHRNTPIGLSALRTRYFDIVSDGGLTTFVPQARYVPQDSAYTLHCRISPAPDFKLGFGGYLSSGPNQIFGDAAYTYYAPYTLRAYLNFYLGTIYNSQKFLLRTDFRTKRWDIPVFVEIGETYNSMDYYSKNPELAFSDTRPDFLNDNEAFGFFNVGTNFPSVDAAMRLRVSGGRRTALYYNTINFLSEDKPDQMQLNFVSSEFSIESNSLDVKTFPTKGMRQQISASYIYGVEQHVYGTTSELYDSVYPDKTHFIGRQRLWRFKAMRTQYFQMSRYFSLGYYAEGVYAQFANLANYYANMLLLPAFEPLQHTHGLFLENFRSNIYVAFGIIPTHIMAFISPRIRLRAEAYVFAPFAELRKDNTELRAPPQYNKTLRNIYFLGSVAAVLNTPAGNLSFSVSYYDRSHPVYRNIFYSLNFGYYINNRKAF